MNETNIGVPAPAPTTEPSTNIWQAVILPKLMRSAFVLVRMAVVALATWAATHKIGWVSDLLGSNVDAIAAAIIGAISVGFHEADIFCHLHPELIPARLKPLWDFFHRAAGDEKAQGGFIRAQIIFALAFFALVGMLCFGCATHTVERDARAVAHKIIQIGVTDANGFLRTINADLDNLATNQQAQAELAAAIIAAAAK